MSCHVAGALEYSNGVVFIASSLNSLIYMIEICVL